MSREEALENYSKLPAVVKRRVRALKKLQYENMKIYESFYREILELEKKYNKYHKRIFDKRRAIVNGLKEPSDDECHWSDDEHSGDEDDVADPDTTDLKGIPKYWPQTLRNMPEFSGTIEEHDLKVLKYLTDIKCVLHIDHPGFTFEFHFSPNPYFPNNILTKRYYLHVDVPFDKPLEYDGPEIVRTEGCTINWNPGKNVTVRTIKKEKKKKHGPGSKRTITKIKDSFFHFFDPPTQHISEDMDDGTKAQLENDFHRGRRLKVCVTQKSVLFFTGEALTPDSDDKEEADDDHDDDDEEDGDESSDE